MDRREHHRAQLSLPVRLRWATPFGQRTEICKTADISRGGLLVPCEETHAPGATIWVTFPFDGSVRDGQPEMLARVLRVMPANNGDHANDNGPRKLAEDVPHERCMALHFLPSIRTQSNGNGHNKDRDKDRERRECPRPPLALPVRIRPEHVPWFEEAMTIEVSAHGLRFLSTREYQIGQQLLISFDPAASSPWPASETRSRILRIEPVPESTALAVTVVREA
jgi:hypothetical protein